LGLEQQLAADGRLVAPVGSEDQRLVLVQRTGSGFERTALEGVRFVPLVADG
jgi:protein-L-isoaspartate(D-aspartate) O-methyltransferase